MLKKKNHRRKCRISLVLISLSLSIMMSMGTAFASVGVNVDYHSQEEIKSKIESIYDSNDFKVTYDKKPVYKGPDYDPGKLSQKTLNGAVDILNGLRYIAGIPYNVQLKSEYINMAQAGALVNAANGAMTHYPSQPSGISDSLYQLGRKGCSSSNLYWGITDFEEGVTGWISDEYSTSGLDPGHRRWCLNPSMQYTGFGMVDDHAAMYAFDGFRNSTAYTGVAWPAQEMPLEFFNMNTAWSISFGRKLDPDSIDVSLTRSRDNKTWNFDSQKSDGNFMVSNVGYGQSGCVIFKPEFPESDLEWYESAIEEYLPDDIFHVVVRENGNAIADYQVHFFEVFPVEKIALNHNSLKMEEYTSKELKASVYPDNAKEQDVFWESSNSKIAEVDEYGELYAKKAGTAVITAKNRYGNVTASCKVKVLSYKDYYRPAKAKVKSVSSSSKHDIKVTWEKTKGTGYQIRYSTSPSFKSYKTVTVRKSSQLSRTIKNLKKNKTYYVKVRAYRWIYGENIYGAFSDVAKVRCK